MNKLLKLLSIGVIVTLVAMTAVSLVGVNNVKAEGEQHTVTFELLPDDDAGKVTITSQYHTLEEGTVTVDENDTLTFTVEANSGYRFEEAEDNGTPMTPEEEEDIYTFEIASIDGDHAVTLTFVKTHEITFTFDPDESVGEIIIISQGHTLEEGTVTVDENDTLTFTVEANSGYRFEEAEDNGTPMTPEEEEDIYTFEIASIDGDHAVTLTFVKTHHKVTFVFDENNGEVLKADGTSLEEGKYTLVPVGDGEEELKFKVVPSGGYKIQSVKVSEEEIEPESGVYTIVEINDDITVVVIFKKKSSGSRGGSSHDSDLPTTSSQTLSSGLLLEKSIGEMTQAEIRAKLIEAVKLLLTKLEQLLALIQQRV